MLPCVCDIQIVEHSSHPKHQRRKDDGLDDAQWNVDNDVGDKVAKSPIEMRCSLMVEYRTLLDHLRNGRHTSHRLYAVQMQMHYMRCCQHSGSARSLSYHEGNTVEQQRFAVRSTGLVGLHLPEQRAQ
jgi:hypothetical protein